MKKKKQLKPGVMVQIWDHHEGMKMTGHGQVGYLVQNFGETGKLTPDGSTSSTGVIWQVICFNHEPPEKYKVHESWLNPVDKISDIKKVEDD